MSHAHSQTTLLLLVAIPDSVASLLINNIIPKHSDELHLTFTEMTETEVG